MSKYTTELRYICENLAGIDGSVDDIIQAAIPAIFNFDFPIFDENYRSVLEAKIVRHFYTREIGLETFALWQLKLETRMVEYMPYANKLYLMLQQEIDPLITENYQRNYNGNLSYNGNTQTEGSDTRNDTTTPDLISKRLDTPQGNINNLLDGNYLTYANQETGSTSTTGSTTTKNQGSSTSLTTDGRVEKIVGKTGGISYGKLMKEYKEGLINVDKMVFDYLEPLFMQIW